MSVTGKQVTAESSDEEILAAIDAAGEKRWSWRSSDIPSPDDPDQKSWVKPGDIGESTSANPKLLERLWALRFEGLLDVHPYINPPRFRTIKFASVEDRENRDPLKLQIRTWERAAKAKYDARKRRAEEEQVRELKKATRLAERAQKIREAEAREPRFQFD